MVLRRLQISRSREAGNLSRWWYTLRYHRPSQLAWRGVNLVRRRLFPLLPKGRYDHADASSLTRRTNPGFNRILSRQLELRTKRRDCCDAAAALLAGEFEFLNERRTLSMPIDWTLASGEPAAHLWRFHLHYHEFLFDLLAASRALNDREYESRLWSIIADWIAANPLDRRGSWTDAWHPFCLSKRIAVWLLVWHAADPPQEFREPFVTSLETQIRFLERHLEWDLRGNHLFENLRTLILAATFFDGRTAERRLDKALKIFREQLAEQILPSGEHFERSPMYHAQMLSALLDVRDVVAAVRPDFAAHCAKIVERMRELLRVLVHPDGHVALLGDTALGETPPVDVLLSDAHDSDADDALDSSVSDSQVSGWRRSPDGSRTYGEPLVIVRGEYWKWQHAGDCLLFDAGPVGADELPAHAHCDLLTFEASISGQRVFVDGGVYDYSDGEMRRYCRSTAAHNVLQIDGVEQCDVWSRFRMGYRGHPFAIEHGRQGEFAWGRATHDAYRRLRVPLVGRWLACRAGGPWLCVDWAEGRGRHGLVSRLHLSPEISVDLVSPHTAQIAVGERLLHVRSLTDAPITLESGWYCPDFGIRKETTVLQFRTNATLPAFLGWMVHDADEHHQADLQTAPDRGIELRWRSGNATTILRPAESGNADGLSVKR